MPRERFREQKISVKSSLDASLKKRFLERGKGAQTPLATVSIGSNEMSLRSNEILDARPCAMRIWRS